jgi:hypothetical protein
MGLFLLFLPHSVVYCLNWVSNTESVETISRSLVVWYFGSDKYSVYLICHQDGNQKVLPKSPTDRSVTIAKVRFVVSIAAIYEGSCFLCAQNNTQVQVYLLQKWLQVGWTDHNFLCVSTLVIISGKVSCFLLDLVNIFVTPVSLEMLDWVRFHNFSCYSLIIYPFLVCKRNNRYRSGNTYPNISGKIEIPQMSTPILISLFPFSRQWVNGEANLCTANHSSNAQT